MDTLDMIPIEGVAPVVPGTVELHGAAGFDDIREAMGRPDLDDAAIATAVAETSAALGFELSVDEVLEMPMEAAIKREIVSCLILPRPQFAMTMAEHDLEPQRAVRKAKLRNALRHVAALSQLNRRSY